jgi:hypothetical protein
MIVTVLFVGVGVRDFVVFARSAVGAIASED